MDSPVQAEMVQFCDESELVIEAGLIQNEQAITLKEAKETKNLVLRWRRRVCEQCHKAFDITTHGLFYQCKRC